MAVLPTSVVNTDGATAATSEAMDVFPEIDEKPEPPDSPSEAVEPDIQPLTNPEKEMPLGPDKAAAQVSSNEVTEDVDSVGATRHSVGS